MSLKTNDLCIVHKLYPGVINAVYHDSYLVTYRNAVGGTVVTLVKKEYVAPRSMS